MDYPIPGLKPLWIITFCTEERKREHINQCYRLASDCLSAAESARECAAEAEKIKDELVHLQDVVEEFRKMLKRLDDQA